MNVDDLIRIRPDGDAFDNLIGRIVKVHAGALDGHPEYYDLEILTGEFKGEISSDWDARDMSPLSALETLAREAKETE